MTPILARPIPDVNLSVQVSDSDTWDVPLTHRARRRRSPAADRSASARVSRPDVDVSYPGGADRRREGLDPDVGPGVGGHRPSGPSPPTPSPATWSWTRWPASARPWSERSISAVTPSASSTSLSGPTWAAPTSPTPALRARPATARWSAATLAMAQVSSIPRGGRPGRLGAHLPAVRAVAPRPDHRPAWPGHRQSPPPVLDRSGQPGTRR